MTGSIPEPAGLSALQHHVAVLVGKQDPSEITHMVKAIDHPMYGSGFSCTSLASIKEVKKTLFNLLASIYLCNQRDAFWVQMCPAVRT